MPYGSGPLVRQALVRATPWQQILIGVAMVAVGAVLVAVGHLGGAVLAVAGVLVLGRMARSRAVRRRALPASGAEGARS